MVRTTVKLVKAHGYDGGFKFLPRRGNLVLQLLLGVLSLVLSKRTAGNTDSKSQPSFIKLAPSSKSCSLSDNVVT